jgi:hypothetical protein
VVVVSLRRALEGKKKLNTDGCKSEIDVRANNGNRPICPFFATTNHLPCFAVNPSSGWSNYNRLINITVYKPRAYF